MTNHSSHKKTPFLNKEKKGLTGKKCIPHNTLRITSDTNPFFSLISKNMLLVIMITAIIAITTYSVMGSNQWEEFQKDGTRSGTQQNLSGRFSTGLQSITSYSPYSSAFQPVITDLNGDGIPNTFGISSGYIYIMEASAVAGGYSFTVQKSLYIGGEQDSNPFIANIDGDVYKEIIVGMRNRTFVLEYNSTHINVQQNISPRTSTGIACANITNSSDQKQYTCFFGSGYYYNDFGTGNKKNNITKFIPATGYTTALDINVTIPNRNPPFSEIGNPGFTGIYGHNQLTPILDDIDGDTYHELVFIANEGAGSGTNNEQSILYSIDTNTFTMSGNYPKPVKGGAGYNNVLSYAALNIDDSTQKEICLTGYVRNISVINGTIQCYSSEGVLRVNKQPLYSNKLTQYNRTYIIDPVAADVDGDSRNEICYAGLLNNTGAGHFWIACSSPLSEDTGFTANYGFHYAGSDAFTKYVSFQPRHVSQSYTTRGYIPVMTVADMDGDGDDDLILGNYVFISDSSQSQSYEYAGSTLSFTDGVTSPTSISSSGHPSNKSYTLPYDINLDNVLNIVFGGNGGLGVIMYGFSDVPPTITGTFGRISNPVCVNTALTFSAKEHEVNNQTVGHNYYNDHASNTERIVSRCGYPGQAYHNGTMSQDNPALACTFNTTGTFVVELVMQDEANKNDYSTSTFVEIVNVINGTEGITCSKTYSEIGETVVEPGKKPSGISATRMFDGLKDVIDLVTGGDSDSKMVLGFIILVIVLVMFIAETMNMMASVMITAICMIILTALGLFPVWILIATFLVLLLLYLLITSTGGGGG